MKISEIELAWEEVVSEFRRVCLLKRDGRIRESEEILANKLPARIATWSRLSPLDAATKKQQLQGMLLIEERRIESERTTTAAVAPQVPAALLNEIKEQIAAELRQQFTEWMSQMKPAIEPTGRVAKPSSELQPPPWKSAAPTRKVEPSQPLETTPARPEMEDIATALDRVLASQVERLSFSPQHSQQL